MSDQIVQVAPDSTGKKIQTFENTIGGNLVEAQAVVLVDSTGTPITPSGSFFEFETARVDASGNDGTGVVGDIAKPFLTVQAAINAIEAGSFTNPVVNIGNYRDLAGTVSTSLRRLSFIGCGDDPYVCGDLVLTSTIGGTTLTIQNCSVSTSLSVADDTGITINLFSGNLPDVSYSGTGGLVSILGLSDNRALNIISKIATTTAGAVRLSSLTVDEIDCAGVNVALLRGAVDGDVTACGVLTLTDARVLGANNASSTVYSDELLNKTPIAGGSTGDVLTKASNADFDMVWSASAGGGISFAMAAGLATVL